MNKKLIFVAFVMLLIFAGCSKKTEQDENVKTDNCEMTTATPKPTSTPSPIPTPAIPWVDSGDEKFENLTEEQGNEIRALRIDDNNYDAISRLVIAYYEYIDAMDTKLPVVIYATAEEVSKNYQGEWLEIFQCGDREKEFKYCYGILSAEDVKNIMLNKIYPNIELCEDESIKGGGGSMDESTAIDIRFYRYWGAVHIEHDAYGSYWFEGTDFDD